MSFDRPFPSLWLMAMRSILTVLSIALVAACAAPTPAPVPAGPDPTAQASPTADAGPEAAAQAAAEAWLAHIDREDYEASWRSAAEGLRQQVTAEQWAETGRQVRQQTGAARNRTLQEAQHTTDLPQAPPGEYVVLIYRTSYERGDATEQVVMRLEDDGEWRTIGFFVRP